MGRSRHFSGEKLDKKETIKEVRKYVVDIFDGRFCVKFDNDDGGTVLNVYLEVETSSLPLEGFYKMPSSTLSGTVGGML